MKYPLVSLWQLLLLLFYLGSGGFKVAAVEGDPKGLKGTDEGPEGIMTHCLDASNTSMCFNVGKASGSATVDKIVNALDNFSTHLVTLSGLLERREGDTSYRKEPPTPLEATSTDTRRPTVSTPYLPSPTPSSKRPLADSPLPAGSGDVSQVKVVSGNEEGLPPEDCMDLLLMGHTKSGVYTVQPHSCKCKKTMQVFCDMKTDGGGWTVLLARQEQEVQENFTRPYDEYAEGFGNPAGEYWLGNENMHILSYNKRYVLRAELEDWEGERRWAQYDDFLVDDAENKYKLTLGSYTGDAGNSLTVSNGAKFTAYDRDNDSYNLNCASVYRGGFWFKSCYLALPTGEYLRGTYSGDNTGLNWKSWRGHKYSLRRFYFKIRPLSCDRKVSVARMDVGSCGY